MSLTLGAAAAVVDSAFGKYSSAVGSTNLVGGKLTAGKVYEAWVLARILEHMEHDEGFKVTLIGGTKLHLKSSPGPINPAYPSFRITRGFESYDVWTDVEFSTFSYARTGKTGKPGTAHRHELDIVIVPTGTAGYPAHDQIVVGVECKNTGFLKSLARAALGVRRELSLLHSECQTPFISWPRSSVPAWPPSVMLVYSTDPSVLAYQEAGDVFGVDFFYEAVV